MQVRQNEKNKKMRKRIEEEPSFEEVKMCDPDNGDRKQPGFSQTLTHSG
jgi:hypothetical protein